MSSQPDPGPPPELIQGIEGEKIWSVDRVAQHLDVSPDTVRRRYKNLLVQTSDKRLGMKQRVALTLAKPLIPEDAA
jgi:DNA-binding transcriptional regulator YhcF (GntR family)